MHFLINVIIAAAVVAGGAVPAVPAHVAEEIERLDGVFAHVEAARRERNANERRHIVNEARPNRPIRFDLEGLNETPEPVDEVLDFGYPELPPAA